MLDLSSEHPSPRYARASGKVFADPEVIEAVRNKEVPQGDVATIARSAGIQTACRKVVQVERDNSVGPYFYRRSQDMAIIGIGKRK